MLSFGIAKRRSGCFALWVSRLYRCTFQTHLLNTETILRERKFLVLIHNNFQQWMSRLAHRWRTLRTAIRNANCRIQWVIEILNAHCTFGLYLEVCLYQCPYIKLVFLFLCSQDWRWQNVRCLVGSLFFEEKMRVPLNVRSLFLVPGIEVWLSNAVICLDRFARVGDFG